MNRCCSLNDGCLFAQPTTCVLQYLDHLRLLVDRVGFMTRSEIENFSFTDIPCHSAAEPFTFAPCFLKDNLIRCWYMKWFVVHLGLRHLKRWRQTTSDWVFGQVRGQKSWFAIRPVVWEATPRQMHDGLKLVLVFFCSQNRRASGYYRGSERFVLVAASLTRSRIHLSSHFS